MRRTRRTTGTAATMAIAVAGSTPIVLASVALMVLFVAGGAAGLVLASWLVKLLVAFKPPLPPGVSESSDVARYLKQAGA